MIPPVKEHQYGWPIAFESETFFVVDEIDLAYYLRCSYIKYSINVLPSFIPCMTEFILKMTSWTKRGLINKDVLGHLSACIPVFNIGAGELVAQVILQIRQISFRIGLLSLT